MPCAAIKRDRLGGCALLRASQWGDPRRAFLDLHTFWTRGGGVKSTIMLLLAWRAHLPPTARDWNPLGEGGGSFEKGLIPNYQLCRTAPPNDPGAVPAGVPVPRHPDPLGGPLDRRGQRIRSRPHHDPSVCSSGNSGLVHLARNSS